MISPREYQGVTWGPIPWGDPWGIPHAGLPKNLLGAVSVAEEAPHLRTFSKTTEDNSVNSILLFARL